jgi:hypothetical protein
LEVRSPTTASTMPMARPPMRALGIETNAPKAAAPKATNSWSGPRPGATKEAAEGACRIAETADSPPAMPQVVALTRPGEMPHSRAASWLEAAARIFLPIRVNRRNSAKAATSTGQTMRISRYGLPRMTPPTVKLTWKGTG